MIKSSLNGNLTQQNQMTAVDQIIISGIDILVTVVLFAAGMAVLAGKHPETVIITGFIFLGLSFAYPLLKNILFRSIGCTVLKGFYVREQGSKNGALKLRVLIHNIVSVSPFAGLLFYKQAPYVFYFIILIYIVNIAGYITGSQRVMDSWLGISIARNISGE